MKIRHLGTNQIFYLKQHNLWDSDEKELYETELKVYTKLSNIGSPDIKRFIPDFKEIRPSETFQSDLGYILTGEIETIETKSELLNLISTKKVRLSIKKNDTEKDQIDKLIQYFMDMAAYGLAKIHKQNIIHNDLKRSHILISKNGQIVFIDFNLATVLELNDFTHYKRRELARRKEDEIVACRYYIKRKILRLVRD